MGEKIKDQVLVAIDRRAESWFPDVNASHFEHLQNESGQGDAERLWESNSLHPTDESLGLGAQFGRFISGSPAAGDGVTDTERILWRTCAFGEEQVGESRACVILGSPAPRVLIWGESDNNYRTLDLPGASRCDLCAWSPCGSLLALGSSAGGPALVFTISLATGRLMDEKAHKIPGDGRDPLAGLCFRRSLSPGCSELVTVHRCGTVRRLEISVRDWTRGPQIPNYASSTGGDDITGQLGAAKSVQAIALHNSSDSKERAVWLPSGSGSGTDLLFLACDDRLVMVSLLDSAPFFRTERVLPLRHTGLEPDGPPSAFWGFQRRGEASLPRSARCAKLALSPSSRMLASLSKGGKLRVRNSGMHLEQASGEPVDLGDSLVARCPDAGGETGPVLDFSWWSEDKLLIATDSKTVVLAYVDPNGTQNVIDLEVSLLSEQCQTSFPVSTNVVFAARDTRESRPVAFVLDCQRRWVPDSDPSAHSLPTPRANGRAMVRKYSLRTIAETSATELFAHFCAVCNWSAALKLGEAHGLDLDEVFKAQWRSALRAPNGPTKDEVVSILRKISDIEWIVQQCRVQELPRQLDATEALFEIGLDRAEAQFRGSEHTQIRADTSMIEGLKQDLCKLHAFDALSRPNAFDSGRFAQFRRRSPLHVARRAAEKADVKSVGLLLESFVDELVPQTPVLLSLFPETLSAVKYADLLPAWPETYEAGGAVHYFVFQSGQVIERAKCEAWAGPSDVAVWYANRAREIDSCSGMLDVALELCECGIQRLEAYFGQEHVEKSSEWEDLLHLRDSASILARLVYQCGMRETTALVEWESMNDYVRLCTLAESVGPNNVVDVLTSRLVPLYRDAEPAVVNTWLGHLRVFMIARASGRIDPACGPDKDGMQQNKEDARVGIQICAAIIRQSVISNSNGGVDRSQRIIPFAPALIEIALACIYACPCVDQGARTAMDTIFESLPARMPELEGRMPALKLLQDRAEILDTHLAINERLAPFNLQVPLTFFLDCCKQREESRANRLAGGKQASGMSQDESSASEEQMESPDKGDSQESGEPVMSRRDSMNGDPSAEQDSGKALLLSLFRAAAHADQSEWVQSSHIPDKDELLRKGDQAVSSAMWTHIVDLAWDIKRRALPYISDRFCTQRTLIALLRATQFDLAHELISSIGYENGQEDEASTPVLSRVEVEEIILSVSKEFFNSASDFSFQEMDYAKRALRALPFQSTRVREESALFEVMDMLANDFDIPLIPLQVRMLISSESQIALIEKVLSEQPNAYKLGGMPNRPDAKLLRLASLLGLGKPEQIAQVRSRIVESAVRGGDFGIAQIICDAMIEKIQVLEQQQQQSCNQSDGKHSSLADAKHSLARACLCIARWSPTLDTANQVLHSKRSFYAKQAFVFSSDDDLEDCVDIVRRLQQDVEEKCDDPVWSELLDTGTAAFRSRFSITSDLEPLDSTTFAEWAVAELIHNQDAAALALSLLLAPECDESEIRIARVSDALAVLRSSLEAKGALGGLEVPMLHALVAAAALSEPCAPGDERQRDLDVISTPTKRLLSALQAGLTSSAIDLKRSAFIAGLCEQSATLLQGQHLSRLFPGVDSARFSDDGSFRKDVLLSACHALGATLTKNPAETDVWQGVLSISGEYDDINGPYAVDQWAMHASYLSGVLMCDTASKSESELDTFARKSPSLAAMSKEREDRIRTLAFLSAAVWDSMQGIRHKRLALVERIIFETIKSAALKKKGPNDDDTEPGATDSEASFESTRSAFKERRSFYLRLEKLGVAVDVKILVPSPALLLRAMFQSCDSAGPADDSELFIQTLETSKQKSSIAQANSGFPLRDSALPELVRVMTKKNSISIAKLASKAVKVEPKLRPSEILLAFLEHALGVGSADLDANEDVPPCITEVPRAIARASRQTYSNVCAPLIDKLVVQDLVSFGCHSAFLGGRLQVLDLDLRERIAAECSAQAETKKVSPQDDPLISLSPQPQSSFLDPSAKAASI